MHYALARVGQCLATLRTMISQRRRLAVLLVAFVLSMLAINIGIIVYTLFSLIGKMSSNGIPVVDSIPLFLYVLPLVVILLSIFRGYYLTHVGLGAIIILLVTGVLLGMLSVLVHGFAILAVMNIGAIVVIPLLGNIRSKTSLRNIGRKGLVWLIILNILGAAFPVAVYVMGQTPIAHVNARTPSLIKLDVPLASDVAPTNETIQLLTSSGVEPNLLLLDYSPESWSSLSLWLSDLTGKVAGVTITVRPNRGEAALPGRLGSTELFDTLFSNFSQDITRIRDLLDSAGMEPSNVTVMLDLRLSAEEWDWLMSVTRSLDFVGFASLIRATIDDTIQTKVQQSMEHMLDQARNESLGVGVLADFFIVDDYLSGSGNIMLACGLVPDALNQISLIEIDVSRTKLSRSLNGDVGEYFAYSYAKTIGSCLNDKWSLRLGDVGLSSNETEYTKTEDISRDLAIVGGCGVDTVTIQSLQGIAALGDDALSRIVSLTGVSDSIPITYTFRVYAFRAVINAIDSFEAIRF